MSKDYVDEHAKLLVRMQTSAMVGGSGWQVLQAVVDTLIEHQPRRVLFGDGSGVTITPIPKPTTPKVEGPRLHLAYVDELTPAPTLEEASDG